MVWSGEGFSYGKQLSDGMVRVMTMKVLLDVSRAVEPQLTGIGVYQKELYSNLKKLGKIEVIPFYYGNDGDLMNKEICGDKAVDLFNPYYFSIRKRIYDWLFIAPKIKKKFGKHIVLHSTAYRCISGLEDRTVMTIHDLIFIRDKFHYNKLYHNIVRHYLPRVKGIIAISESVVSEINEVFPYIPNNKIKLVYQGVGDRIKTPISEDKIISYKNKLFGNSVDYILFVGAITRRKNLYRLLKAFKLFLSLYTSSPVYLVIAGKPLDDIDRINSAIIELNLKDKVKYIPKPDDEISLLFNSAKVFVFPSLYEGFGLPVLEAMKCRVPVVCSNTTSLGELFNDAALTVDPLNVEEIANAIYRLWTDDELREKYIELGIKKSMEFTWAKTAENTAKVYEMLFSSWG